MQSIKDIYRIGYGPSSSHTIAPKRAMDYFVAKHGPLPYYQVDLYGSLALTAKGHHTDEILSETVKPSKIIFNYLIDNYDNRFVIKGFDSDHHLIDEWNVLSLGGGSIRIDKYQTHDEDDLYPHNTFNEIKEYLQDNDMDLLSYIRQYDQTLDEHLHKAFDVMIGEVERGLKGEGLLNADLNYYRSAGKLYHNAKDDNDKLISYAYAAGEENAAGHIVCTAPTLGSCGIVASLLYHYYRDLHYAEDILINALAIGGLFGNLIKKNASIAGSLGGCQAEVGSACAMAAAMIAYLDHSELATIEYAAEVGIEHHLGLTCDPVLGYVIVPCIERNAAAILRAFDAYRIAKNVLKVKKNLIDFDTVVASMADIGKMIPKELKETSLGGLARHYHQNKC